MKKEFDSVEKLLRNRSFRKWAEGEADKKETAFWDNWIRKSTRNERLALEAQQRILGFTVKREPESRAEEVWAGIDREMTRREPLPAPGRLHRLPVPSAGAPSPFRHLMKVAAIILVMLTGGLLWITTMDVEQSSEEAGVVYNRVTTEYGEQKEIQLSDGSRVILNANSSLRYTTDTEAANRVDIELEGEAYFSVTSRGHDRFEAGEDIFRVTTRDGSVRVLGTRFTVSSRNEKTTVVLEEGAVAVAPEQGEEATQDEELILRPNELAEFSRRAGGTIRKEAVNPLVYTSWKDPRLFFENTPVREVIERFEQTFGVPFEVHDASLLDRTISGSVENADLATMADIFGEILDVPVRVSDEAVHIPVPEEMK